MPRENLLNKKNITFTIAGSLVSIVVLSAFIGWFFFFSSVPANNYGILYNTVDSKVYTDKVYDNGHYFVPFSTFILFPSTLISVEFASNNANGLLSARSNDGLDVSFDINIQYKILKQDVISVYKQFGTNYDDAIIQIARGTIRSIASKYNAIEYFNNDTIIENEFKSGLRSALAEQNITLSLLQLKGVTLPQSFEDALTAVQVAQQQIQEAKYQQDAEKIKAETLVIQAQAQYNISLIQANASAQVQLINAKATAEALNITFTAKGEAFAQMMLTTGFNQTEILTYLWIDAILNHDSSYLIIGSNAPILIPTTNSTSTNITV